MKFKLDENLGRRVQAIFQKAGYDVYTVYQESIQGASDEQLFSVCQSEHYCLVTLDLDFSNVLRFPPDRLGGIAIIRMPRNPSPPVLERLVDQFLQALTQMDVERKLWIVEIGRVRVHLPDIEDDQ